MEENKIEKEFTKSERDFIEQMNRRVNLGVSLSDYELELLREIKSKKESFSTN